MSTENDTTNTPENSDKSVWVSHNLFEDPRYTDENGITQISLPRGEWVILIPRELLDQLKVLQVG